MNLLIREAQTPREQCLLEALEASVKLQSHYAALLNMYDDGRRLQFASATEWMERLRGERK